MSNALAMKPSGALATLSDVSPWREAANEEAGANFGTLLKFVKGEWLLAEEKGKVSPTTTFTACMDEAWRGWVKWEENKPVAHNIGRVVDRFRVPTREELGDLDTNLWERDDNGVPQDPWVRTNYVVMRNNETGEIVTFTTRSDGGRKALGKLLDYYDRERHKHPGKDPVLMLGSESYYNKKHHTDVDKPKLKVVGWAYWNEEAKQNPAGALQQQHARELMDDEVPF